MIQPAMKLGAGGPDVYPIALGCMAMGAGGWYGGADDAEAIATIHAAIERGVNLLDTGDFYGMGKNELLVGRAVQGRRDRVLISVKYGAQRAPDGSFVGYDASPAATKSALAHSLTRLGVDHIDIYRPSRVDPRVPIEDTVGAITDMVKAGWVRYIGLSEVSAETLRRAAKVHPICDVQLEYSLISRGPETTIAPTLAELGVAMTAYGVLSRGLLSGSKPATPKDVRAHLPRFAGDNGAKNQALVDALARAAAAKRVTPAQLAIAWVRAKAAAQGITVLPVLGSRTPAQLADTLSALDVALTADEVASLEAAVPASAVAGERYGAQAMATLDSERSR